jgi:NAD(P)-dependent dehydrogenase (short-subunit alcohol dehydrogenase family)/acyl carrier protein
VLELRARGLELVLARVDASDEPAMAELVHSLEARWGGVDGVFHFAATIEDKAFGILTDPATADSDLNLGPKVRGARVLARLAEQHELGFVCLASSLSSEFGGLGNYAYARSNRTLDVLAERLNGRNGGRWLAINFDYYRPAAAEDGRRDPREQRSGAMQKLLTEGALRGRDLMNVLERALPLSADAQVIACGQPIEQHVARFTTRESARTGRAARPDLGTAYVPPSSPLERQLTDIWQELLCLDSVGVDDNFFELGGHSLLLPQVVHRLRTAFQVELPLRALFDEPTVEGLAITIEEILLEEIERQLGEEEAVVE